MNQAAERSYPCVETRVAGRSSGREDGRTMKTAGPLARWPARLPVKRSRCRQVRRGLRNTAGIAFNKRRDGGSILGQTADAGRWVHGIVRDRVASDQRDARGGGITGGRADSECRSRVPARSSLSRRDQIGAAGDASRLSIEDPTKARHGDRWGDGGDAQRAAGVGDGGGVANHQEVTTGGQHDHTQIGDDRQETIFQLACVQIEMELSKRIHCVDSRCLATGGRRRDTLEAEGRQKRGPARLLRCFGLMPPQCVSSPTSANLLC
jgi:hypothetical protein